MGRVPVAPTSGGRDPGNLLARARRIEIQRERDLVRRQGLAAGGLLLAVSLSALPSSFLLTDRPSLIAYLVLALGAMAGLACLRAPWNWLPSRWLHVPTLLATGVVCAWIAFTNVDYGVYYVLVAAYAGYVFRWREQAIAEVGVALLAMLVPLLYKPDHNDVGLHTLVLFPVLMIAAGGAIYARNRMEDQRREYRAFAQQALELALRIRGDALLGDEPEKPDDKVERRRVAGALARLSGQGAALGIRTSMARWRVLLAALGAALSLPLAVTALSVAGVTVPDPVRAPFDAVGVGLPNQGSDTDRGTAASGGADSAAADATRAIRHGSQAGHTSQSAGGDGSAGIGTGKATANADNTSEGASAGGSPATRAPSAQTDSAPAQPQGGSSGGPSTTEKPAGPLDRPLDNILNLLPKKPDGSGGSGLVGGLLHPASGD